MGQIPPGLFGLGVATTGALALLAASRPRTRSQWQESFCVWAGPSSDAQDERVSRTHRMVREAIAQDLQLAKCHISVIAHGSSANNTNTKLASDLDLVVIREERWFLPPSGEGSASSGGRDFASEYAAFRQAVYNVLCSSFGWFSVIDGTKCVKIGGTDTTRVPCDVLPAFRVRQYHAGYASYSDGVVFVPKHGQYVVSFPEQHLDNGRTKNVITGYRYKQIVRIVKKLKALIEESQNLLTAIEMPSSFEIEGIVYNAPHALLRKGDLYDAVVAVLGWAENQLASPAATNSILKVSHAGSLFPYWADNANTLLAAIFAEPKEVARFREFARRSLREISGNS